MGRKRNDMQVGSWENITERCPGMRFRFAPWARDEIRAWIMVHINRYSAQVSGLLEAGKAGSKVGEAIASAAASCNTLLRLMNSVDDNWSAVDWHFACNVAAVRAGDPSSGPSLADIMNGGEPQNEVTANGS